MMRDAAARAWLDAWTGEVRRPLRRSLAAAAAGTLLLCAQAGLLAWALQQAIFTTAGPHRLLPALAAYLLLAAARFVLAVVGRRAGFEAGQQVVATVRSGMLAHMRRLGPVWLTRQSSGDMVTRVVDGVDALAPYYARYLPQKTAAVLLPAVVLATVLPVDWVAGVVLAVTAPLVPLFMVLLGDAAERASQRRWTVLTRLGAQFFDSLQGLVTLRLFGAGRARRDRLEEVGEAYRRETMGVLRMAFLSSLVLEFFATVSIAVVAVLVGFRLMWGDVDFLHGMYALLLAPEFFLPLRALGALRHARMDALSVAGDIGTLLAQEPPEAPAASRRSIRGPVAIGLRDVAFEYDTGRAALRGVTLEVPAGTRTSLVGASGSGKSTLLMMLLGYLQPQRGQVSVNGVDLAELDPQAWRRQIAWVPQRPHLFAGSLRENVLLACPQADAAALHRVAAATGLDAVVAALPAGWDTPVGEHGYGLSGGQAQRVALARALLRDAPLLLMDEPTQHLDADSAGHVTRALAELMRGRTVVQVAHRLATASAADRVVVLEAGRVVESGSPVELATAGGAFQRLLTAEGGA